MGDIRGITQSQHYNNGNNDNYDNVMHVSEVSVWFETQWDLLSYCHKKSKIRMSREHSISQLMSYVMDPTVDIGIKTPDAIIPLLQTKHEVMSIEHNPLIE